jgi:hypothetical protein
MCLGQFLPDQRFHVEPHIRFIGSEPVDGILIFQDREGSVDFNIEDLLVNFRHHFLEHLEYELLTAERHFNIDLREFRLPVKA